MGAPSLVCTQGRPLVGVITTPGFPCGRCKGRGVTPGLGRCTGGEKGFLLRNPTDGSLVGYSLWGCRESDTPAPLSSNYVKWVSVSVYLLLNQHSLWFRPSSMSIFWGFPGGPVVKNPRRGAGALGSYLVCPTREPTHRTAESAKNPACRSEKSATTKTRGSRIAKH